MLFSLPLIFYLLGNGQTTSTPLLLFSNRMNVTKTNLNGSEPQVLYTFNLHEHQIFGLDYDIS